MLAQWAICFACVFFFFISARLLLDGCSRGTVVERRSLTLDLQLMDDHHCAWVA